MPVFGGWQRERTKAGIVAQWDEKRVTVDGEQSSNRPEGTTVHRHLGQLRGVCNLAEMRGDARSPETGRANVPNTDRTRDLTPTKAVLGANGKPVAAFTNSGGGTNFLKFLKSELIPHIDSTLRTDPYRVLVGHSLGGLTALDALYTMPDVFNAYVAIDPSLWWDNQVLLTRAKDYFSKPAPSARALFVGQANTLVAGDTAPNTHFLSIGEFNRLVESENRSGIRYAYKYYGDDDHGSVPLMAEYDALRFIFDGYKLDVRKSVHKPSLIAGHFDSVSKRLGYLVRPPERLVDRIAPIDSSMTVALLRLNTEQYPKSAHAFQVLGSALLARRDTASARSALGSALQLDPTNKPAKDAVAKLSGP